MNLKEERLHVYLIKISYHVRNAFPLESERSSFSKAHFPSKIKNREIDDLHFLVRSITRDVPILQLDGSKDSTVTLVKQKEIYILPTVDIFNLLQLEIHVVLTDKSIN